MLEPRRSGPGNCSSNVVYLEGHDGQLLSTGSLDWENGLDFDAPQKGELNSFIGPAEKMGVRKVCRGSVPKEGALGDVAPYQG